MTDSGVVRDEQGHGTAVAGIIAAEGDNGVGTAGVMWRASLMSLRVLDREGAGDVASAVEAIDYAVSKGAHVINISWGTDGESEALRDAIERAGRRGVVVVASAGNGARDLDAAPYYPASFDTRVQDRNGNYITATYEAGTGHLLSVTDTLGRVVSLTYYGDGNLHQITQTWAGGTHVYATFTYASKTMWPVFSGLSVLGPQGGAQQTVLSYSNVGGVHLPYEVQEHGKVNGSLALLRRTTTGYRTDAAFLDRRIIGLVDNTHVYDGATGALVSKLTFGYDWGSEHMEGTAVSVTQHDSAVYGPAFVYGRGNLCVSTRYDVTDTNDPSDTWQETKFGYNETGSRTFTRDHLWHHTFFDYADSFADNQNRNTYAYPTKVTDAGGFFSTVKYSSDHGGTTLTHTPTSGTGANVTFVDVATQYDAHGRVEKVTNLSTQTYKRWVYEPNGNYVHTYETLTGTTQADEFHSWLIMDGAGRTRASASDHPHSTGLFSGRYFVYDQTGRLTQSSKPTEMNGAWQPAGDNAAWVYTSQTYD